MKTVYFRISRVWLLCSKQSTLVSSCAGRSYQFGRDWESGTEADEDRIGLDRFQGLSGGLFVGYFGLIEKLLAK
jgi:hypothetical protein